MYHEVKLVSKMVEYFEYMVTFQRRNMKILAVVGSPRIEGNTNYLVDRALEEAAVQGVEIEKVILSQLDIKPCVGHDNCYSFKKCPQNDDMNPLLEKFLE